MPCDHDETKLVHHNCGGGSEPRVHALVIGVSRYDKQRRPGRRLFEPLPGASRAAMRFARYLVGEFNDPDGRPLGTIRLLVSPMKSEIEELGNLPCNPARTDDVDEALTAWAEDCDRNPDNLGILYVSGHGVASGKGSSTLFLADAPARGNKYTASISLTSVVTLMGECAARDNIFLFDCCALPDVPEMPLHGGLSIGAFERLPGAEPRPVRETSVFINAARVGASTFAIDDQGTLLSRGLLGLYGEETSEDALLVTAGEIKGNRYGITVERLDEELPRRLKVLLDARRKEAGSQDTIASPPSVLARPGRVKPITNPDPPPKYTLVLKDLHANRVPPVSLRIMNRHRELVCDTADVPDEYTIEKLDAGIYNAYVLGQGESIPTPLTVELISPEIVSMGQ